MKKTRIELKSAFVTGYKPTQQDYTNVFDSFQHVDDAMTAEGVLAAIADADLSDLAAALRGVYWQKAGMYFIVDGSSPDATDNRISVGPLNVSVPYKTIAAALLSAQATAAATGTSIVPTVLVRPGLYVENVSVTMANGVNLIYDGVNHRATNGSTAAALLIGTNDTLSNFVMINSSITNTGTTNQNNSACVFVAPRTGVIQGIGACSITSTDGYALWTGTAGGQKMSVRNVTLNTTNGPCTVTADSPLQFYDCNFNSVNTQALGSTKMELYRCVVTAYANCVQQGGCKSGDLRFIDCLMTSLNGYIVGGGSLAGNSVVGEDYFLGCRMKAKLGIMAQGIGGGGISWQIRLEKNIFEITNPASTYAFGLVDNPSCTLDSYGNRSTLALFNPAPANAVYTASGDYINANTKVVL